MNKSGFIEGTLVHTDKGLIPIEKIKVGDIVISKSEENGNIANNPVTNIVINQNEPILALHVAGGDTEEFIFTSCWSSFWVFDVSEKKDKVDTTKGNWVNSESLNFFSPISMLKLEVGMMASIRQLFKSVNLKNAFYPAYAEFGFPTGYSIDMKEYKKNNIYVPPKMGYKEACQSEETGTEIPFDDVVYSLEIEDYHTYFVGTEGLWVHE